MKGKDSDISIGVIILNWLKPNETIQCATSVLSEFDLTDASSKFHLVIVDNGSGGKDVRQVQDWMDTQERLDIELVVSDTNRGYSGGINLGVNALQISSPNYYWLLNNDLVVESGAASNSRKRPPNSRASACLKKVYNSSIKAGTDVFSCID